MVPGIRPDWKLKSYLSTSAKRVSFLFFLRKSYKKKAPLGFLRYMGASLLCV